MSALLGTNKITYSQQKRPEIGTYGNKWKTKQKVGGRYWVRTNDFHRVKVFKCKIEGID